MKKLGVTYKVGVILSFLALAGVAESITGRGDTIISTILLSIGFLCCLKEYIR